MGGLHPGAQHGRTDHVRGLGHRLDALPRVLVDSVKRLYKRPEHAKFVRVAFAVARLNPRFEELMKRIFIENATLGMRMVIQPFVAKGQIDGEAGVHLTRMLINAAGLRMIEHKVLFGHDTGDGELDRFLEFVVDAGERLVKSYRQDD